MIDKSDWKYVGVEPDADFDPKHNEKVIAEVMKKNQVQMARNEKEKKVLKKDQVLSLVMSKIRKITQRLKSILAKSI